MIISHLNNSSFPTFLVWCKYRACGLFLFFPHFLWLIFQLTFRKNALILQWIFISTSTKNYTGSKFLESSCFNFNLILFLGKFVFNYKNMLFTCCFFVLLLISWVNQPGFSIPFFRWNIHHIMYSIRIVYTALSRILVSFSLWIFVNKYSAQQAHGAFNFITIFMTGWWWETKKMQFNHFLFSTVENRVHSGKFLSYENELKQMLYAFALRMHFNVFMHAFN